MKFGMILSSINLKEKEWIGKIKSARLYLTSETSMKAQFILVISKKKDPHAPIPTIGREKCGISEFILKAESIQVNIRCIYLVLAHKFAGHVSRQQ